MRKMKKVLSLALATALCVSMAGCSSKPAETQAPKAEGQAEGSQEAAAPADDYHLVLKLSHVFAPEEQLTKTMDSIAANILERTNGAIEIQTYPQGQLATYKDGVEQVVRGADFISVEDPSYLGDYVPDFNILAGPMLVNSYDEYEYLLETPEVQDMFKRAEEKGIKILSLDYIFGFRSLMTNKVITKPEDLKGMKIRTPGSQLYVDTLNHMGATATPLAFSETISAVRCRRSGRNNRRICDKRQCGSGKEHGYYKTSLRRLRRLHQRRRMEQDSGRVQNNHAGRVYKRRRDNG